MNRKRIALGAAVAAVVIGGGVAAVGVANAGTTNTPARPYIVSNSTINDGETDTITVAGRSFNGTAVPSNATSVALAVSVSNPSSSGRLTVYTTGTSRPSSPTLNYSRHNDTTATTNVTLSGSGRINVYSSERMRYSLRLLSYSTPDTSGPSNCTETISTINPVSSRTLTNVGGSIRSGATDFGSVMLPAGTYDTRVIGGFTGANNNDSWYPSGLFLTGTMVIVKGATIAADFSNDITTGGVIIPKSDSSTLTQDPTLAISTFLTLAVPTDVHVKLFAYASNSGTAGSGQLKGNLQSAQFRKLC